MRAVDALMECLKAEGVDVVFGLPGGANLPTYDAFYDAGIRHILVRHEAGGGHAAEGYAKATGKVGVSLATSGPGATNLVTPICDAMMDSVPVVFITGQVRTELLGTDGFQEADTIGITMPIVKHSFMIQHPLEIPRSIHEAFHIARTGRPGPVVVDIPQDLSRADIPYEPVTDVRLPGYQPTTEGNQKQIRLAAKALANARRPVIYAGGGVIASNAAAELTELATADRFPVTCTVMGLGALPGAARAVARDARDARHPRRELRDGRGGPDLSRSARGSTTAITGKLSEFAPRAKFIHIDVDPAEISKNVPAHIPIVGDAKNILPRLTAEYRALDGRPSAARGVVVADPRLAGALSARLRGLDRLRDQAAVHDPGAVRGDRRRRDRHQRRRPASDVDRAVLPLRQRRAGGSTPAASGRWASACRRRWARRSAARIRRSSASPATARCR